MLTLLRIFNVALAMHFSFRRGLRGDIYTYIESVIRIGHSIIRGGHSNHTFETVIRTRRRSFPIDVVLLLQISKKCFFE